jgi:hypothetical protein
MLNLNLSTAHPGWIILMVIAFLVWWPFGVLTLAFILWSGSMGRQNGQWWQRLKSFGGSRFSSSGNDAFDKHRKETLQRLEEEEKEFRAFIDKLRFTKDADEFDRWMKDRKAQ